MLAYPTAAAEPHNASYLLSCGPCSVPCFDERNVEQSRRALGRIFSAVQCPSRRTNRRQDLPLSLAWKGGDGA
jgi:hypothetical protein